MMNRGDLSVFCCDKQKTDYKHLGGIFYGFSYI